MQQAVTGKKGHKKLKIFFCLCTALLVGFFVYKYAYIYIERQKYNHAATAIQKVADDLRTKGLETSLSKDCSKDQGKFGSGSLFCSVGITYNGDERDKVVKDTSSSFENSMRKYYLSPDSRYSTSFEVSPEPSGSTIYSLERSSFQCQLRLTNTWDEDTRYTIDLFCGDTSRFQLY